MHLYQVTFIHKMYDWDCAFEFYAPDARTARKWAAVKLFAPEAWLCTHSRRGKINK